MPKNNPPSHFFLLSDPSCQVMVVEPSLVQLFPRCIQYYSEKNEDMTKYHKPKWIPIYNESHFESLFQRSFLCPRPWRYETAEQLRTLSFQGLYSVYSGGGYVADLGYNREDAQQVIDSLEINNWIDNITAAVFIEFTLYEPATSLFCAIKMLFERFPNGGTNTVSQFKTLTVYSPQDPNFRGAYETCQLLFMLFILVCVGIEVVKIYQSGFKYFKDPWSWLEIVLLGSSVLSLAVFFLKEFYTSKFILKVKENPFQSWSTDDISLWSDTEVFLLSFVVFLVTMKLLRIIRFNSHIIQMRMTLSSAAKFFWSFTAVFMTIIIAYVMLTTLTFGRSVEQYHSFLRSFSSVLLMLIGAKAPFHKLRTISIFIGPFFVFAYMVTIVMIFLNMFLAILNDAYTESREQGQEGLQDLKISKLLKKKAKKTVMGTKEVVIKVIQAVPKFAWLKQSKTFVAFENEEWNGPDAVEEDSASNDGDNITLRDIMVLLKSIKNDISDSVLSLDDIVPVVTIHDPDEKWTYRQCYSDDEDGQFYSCSSLFRSESNRQLCLKSDKNRLFRYDHLIMDEWNRRNKLVGETFV